MTSSVPAAGDGLAILVVESNVVRVDVCAPMIRKRFPRMRVLCAKDGTSLEDQIAEADVIIAGQSDVPVQLFDKARRLRWFQNTSAGVDRLVPIRDRLCDVIITNARGLVSETIADFVMGGITALHWDFPRLIREQSRKEWNQQGFVATLSERTLGVIGLGAIGTAIARRGKSFGMTVVGSKRDASQPVPGIDKLFPPEDLVELLQVSDFVVLAVPLNPETTKLIGRDQLQQMRRGAFLVNIARGGIVVESELIHALKTGIIAGALLDVFEREPLPSDSPLWTMRNVMITPHASGNAEGYVNHVFELFVDNMQRFLAKTPMRNLIDLRRGY